MTSSDDARTSDEADASGASGHVKDGRARPKNLRNASERIRESLEQWEEKRSPRPGPDELDEVPSGAQRVQERPTGERVVKTNAPYRETELGVQLGEQVRPGDVERNSDRRKVVEGA